MAKFVACEYVVKREERVLPRPVETVNSPIEQVGIKTGTR